MITSAPVPVTVFFVPQMPDVSRAAGTFDIGKIYRVAVVGKLRGEEPAFIQLRAFKPTPLDY
jgi:hypothetical protein